MPVSTKTFFLTDVKQETDVRKKTCLSGHGLFTNRPAVTSLPSDSRLTVAETTRTGTNRLSGHGPWSRHRSGLGWYMGLNVHAQVNRRSVYTICILCIPFHTRYAYIWHDNLFEEFTQHRISQVNVLDFCTQVYTRPKGRWKKLSTEAADYIVWCYRNA